MNEEKLIFTLKAPTLPGDIWQYSLSDEKVTRLTYIGRSEVQHLWREPEMCTFTSFDGLEIPHFYYEKEAASDKPAVVYVHGGPESQTRAEYNPVIQYLVDQGFAVAASNVRGSMGYGRTYVKLDDARKRMDSVQDLAWLVKDLVRSHGVNAEKLKLWAEAMAGSWYWLL